MTSCEQIIQVIYQYLDQDMTADNVVTIKTHLELCRGCYSRVEFERLLRDHMRHSTSKPCPDRVKKRIQDIMSQF